MENKKELNNHQMEDVSGGSNAIYGDNVDGKNPLGRKPCVTPHHGTSDSAQKWVISPDSSEKSK